MDEYGGREGRGSPMIVIFITRTPCRTLVFNSASILANAGGGLHPSSFRWLDEHATNSRNLSSYSFLNKEKEFVCEILSYE